MHIISFSDTHRHRIGIPDGDMLIFAGDDDWGTKTSFINFIDYVATFPHKYKIIIAGNHDFYAECNFAEIYMECAKRGIIYLEDSGIEIEGYNIWGSPYSPTFNDWAFMKDRGDEISKHWDIIPEDTDILITHGPPMYHLDYCQGGPLGCYDLNVAVNKIKPKVHIFGHIHNQSGIKETPDTIYINASIVDDYYQECYTPKEIDIT